MNIRTFIMKIRFIKLKIDNELTLNKKTFITNHKLF